MDDDANLNLLARGRYVILRHELPPDNEQASHYDLMFEAVDGLATWAIDAPPAIKPLEARQLPVHRRTYLDYEGPVSASRGRVDRWDFGTFEVLPQGEDDVRLALRGARLAGQLTLHSSDQCWSVSFVPSRMATRPSASTD